jgi:hypothetical protein
LAVSKHYLAAQAMDAILENLVRLCRNAILIKRNLSTAAAMLDAHVRIDGEQLILEGGPTT